ncbi:hypothetical protein NDU88_005589 [Pleurodeles waltl]|uniref:Uncharacterized protein n=1 Tax=Pleurodeles waltl TaxID=8319 RepID=A0AAV7LPX9_PLEWA|nr:hypothetical protein NDU88_005589 [Pleurodeles waltl]
MLCGSHTPAPGSSAPPATPLPFARSPQDRAFLQSSAQAPMRSRGEVRLPGAPRPMAGSRWPRPSSVSRASRGGGPEGERASPSADPHNREFPSRTPLSPHLYLARPGPQAAPAPSPVPRVVVGEPRCLGRRLPRGPHSNLVTAPPLTAPLGS